MNRKWLAALIVVLGLIIDAQGDQLVFQAVPKNVVTNFNPSLLQYNGVACNGFNFFCVGSNSVASLAGTNFAPVAGGYLTTNIGWTAKNVSTQSYNLNAVTYGTNIFLATGSANMTFIYSGSSWGSPQQVFPGNNVDAQGVAYNSVSETFALVTASYQAAWATASLAGWTNASDIDAAVVESLRSVTALGGSNFALCGIHGDIRISSNGGRSWNTNQFFDFSQPDLLAIASDGSNSIVSAGSSGMREGIGQCWRHLGHQRDSRNQQFHLLCGRLYWNQ